MIINKTFLEKLEQIHALSKNINGKSSEKHTKKLIKMIKDHAKEIKQLHKINNPHFLIETGDLIILCLELLKEHNVSIDDTLEKCIERFSQKLASF
jgi:phosphoribosyl-ATP pyrophosphohydrolase